MTISQVPFVDLERQHAPLRHELAQALDRVTDTSAFILGGEVAGFEAEFAAYCGVDPVSYTHLTLPTTPYV